MAKTLFVGNLAEGTQANVLIRLFKKYGTVETCKVFKNYGFVQMKTERESRSAMQNLNGYILNNLDMVVDEAKITTRKIFVGQLANDTCTSQVRTLFERYGTVIECYLVRNFGFVSLQYDGNIYNVINELDGTVINNKAIKVQLSRNNIQRTGNPEQCYSCGRSGHWSKDCPYQHGPSLPPSPSPPQPSSSKKMKRPMAPPSPSPPPPPASRGRNIKYNNYNYNYNNDADGGDNDHELYEPRSIQSDSKPPLAPSPPQRNDFRYKDFGRYTYISPEHKLFLRTAAGRRHAPY